MKAQQGSVRIIAGEQRRRRLHFIDQGGDLRPSTDRLRETLFNWIQFDINGRRVLDLFAGSGILAAEALSRGAASAELVENKPARARQLRRELTPLFADRIKVHSMDALRWLARYQGKRFTLIFIDPPYDLGIAAAACDLLMAQQLLANDALIYVESRSHEAPIEVPNSWQLQREKISGEVAARLYRYSPV